MKKVVAMPTQTFRSHESAGAKSISGPMLLAAHWPNRQEGTVRIQITAVNKSLPLRPFSVRGRVQRRK